MSLGKPLAQKKPLPDGVLPQRTREFSCPNLYLRIKLSFTGNPRAVVSQQLFADVLQAALTQLYGIVGGALPYTLLHFTQPTGCCATVVMRVDKQHLERFWSACACLTTYNEHEARLIVTSASPFLSSLANDSREWIANHLPDIMTAASASAQPMMQ